MEKRFTIEDGDFSDCPQKYLKPLKKLLDEFKDRFLTFKLDVEVTDMYTADLETEPVKKLYKNVEGWPIINFSLVLKQLSN